MIRGHIEPLVRERLRDLPNTIRLRTMPRIRTSLPVRSPRIYRVDRGAEEWNAALGAGTMAIEGDGDDVFFDDTADFLENDPDFDDSFILELQAPIEFENEIEPVSPEVLQELAATAARDAQFALKQLAAAGIA
jgi:hypothetical protein